MRTVVANQALTIHGRTLPEGRTRMLLQNDKLHPSPPGCAVVALAALDTLQVNHAFPSSDIRWDPKEILRLVLRSMQSPAGGASKPGAPEAPAHR